MAKLQKSIEKREALLKATLHLVNQGGFQGASMSKVAKEANVSPATIYLYFENKQDLLNKLYLDVKANFSIHAFEGYSSEKPVKKGFEKIWFNMIDFKLNQIDESNFLSQCDNTPLIDEESQQEGLKHLQPLLDLWKKGQEEGIIKNISPFLLYAFTIYPMAFLLTAKKNKHCNLDNNNLNQAFSSAWDSIKI